MLFFIAFSLIYMHFSSFLDDWKIINISGLKESSLMLKMKTFFIISFFHFFYSSGFLKCFKNKLHVCFKTTCIVHLEVGHCHTKM